MSTFTELSADLIEGLRRKDPELLSSLVLEHTRPLFRAARGMGFTNDEAEDLIQDVFMTFLETLHRFEGRSQIRTWLFGILHNKVHERRRDQYRTQQEDPIDETFESRFDAEGKWIRPPEDLDRLMASKEIEIAIQGCLKGLPAPQREVFVLREVEELETSEICKILGITVTNMSVLIHRARIRLRECLEARGWRNAR